MIRTAFEEEQSLLRITLASPKANILDIATLDAIAEALLEPLPQSLRGVLVDHDGPDFSFGAAVAEHLPEKVAEMLHSFGRAVRAMVHAPVPVLVAVDGRALGGGMELALCGHFLFAHQASLFGQPEITLGVIPPAAIAFLPFKPPLLRRMVLTGEILPAGRLEACGLVSATTEGPTAEAALEFFRQHFMPRSAFALRELTRAVDPGNDFDQALYRAEQHYLQDLMEGRDPVEGLTAFLERRAPRWEHA